VTAVEVVGDDAVREEALDPWRSFIVEAPAGSGKTALLTRRFLRLLTVVERPESIVAMTFTRKAAGEMRERIHQALQDAAAATPVQSAYEQRTRQLAQRALDRDQAKGWNLLADVSQLQVQTIDSLCAMLARQMPVVSESGGIGKVVEDARDLYRIAARRTLRNLTEGLEEDQNLFQRLALHFDNDITSLERQIAGMLQKRDQWDFLANGEEPSLIDDFCQLLSRARSVLRQVFRQSATVDFAEVAHAARRALGTPESPTDLLYSLDYRIEHLLVDEFQDTSRAQFELVRALTEQWSAGAGHSLFLVGDPMQSIYRFREAEVALFLRCWHTRQLGAVPLEPLRLTSNFRSTRALVDWVRETVSPVMAEDNPRLGAVKFRTSQAAREDDGAPPRVNAFIGDDGQREAAEIVRIIQGAPAGNSIAILARGRLHLTGILPALRRAGIPYRAQEIDALKDQQHVIDLIALTRALSHLGDRVSWLACLRAPWCGLTLADLSALAENEPNRTILELLSDAEKLALLSPDGRSRAVRVQEILAEAVDKAARVPLRDLVESAWFALGGPSTLREVNQHDDAAIFLDLIESLDDGGALRDFSILDQRLEIFYAKPAAEQTCVQVMTVHGAKGLEFDIVIIPQMAKLARSADRDLLVWTEDTQPDGTISLNLAAQPQRSEKNSAYELISKENSEKEAEEMKRLFYVACTRAKNELYLFGSVTRKKDELALRKPSSSTFLGLIWPAVREQFEAELHRRAPAQQGIFSFAAEEAGTTLRRLPGDWRLPQPEPVMQWTAPLQRAVASTRKLTYEWVGDTSRHVGTVVHELLKRRSAGDAQTIHAELLRLGVPKSEVAAAAGRVGKAISSTLNSKRGSWILQSHAEAKSEWAIAGRIQDKLTSGTIDRTFRDEQGRLWIIDFKTSAHSGGQIENFLNEEQRRYRPQLENYATLLARTASGPIWLGLYFPLLDGWREWPFEQETAVSHYTGE
jgi:ATP-dependent helicase/nuclease subunit A